jgi:hypothetical protein
VKQGFLGSFGTFVVFVLVVTGLTGIDYNLFREVGWIESVFSHPLVLLFVIVGAVILGVMWSRDTKTELRSQVVPNLLFYLMVAAGVYFIGHLAITGTL